MNPTLATIRLTHVGERWYDPAIGRFVQRDPIGLRGGMNLYGYGAQNPVTNFDADGKEWLTVGIIVGVAVAVSAVIYYICDMFNQVEADSKNAAVQRKIASQRGYPDYCLGNMRGIGSLLNTPGMSNNWQPGLPTDGYSSTKAIVEGGIGLVGGP